MAQAACLGRKKNVLRLIEPFPKHAKIDAILRNIENDDTALDDGEQPYDDDDAVSITSQSHSENNHSDEDGNEAGISDGYPNCTLEDDAENTRDAGIEEPDKATSLLCAVAEESDKPDDNAIAKGKLANEHVEHATNLVNMYEDIKCRLESYGQMSAVAQMENLIHKENRRIRVLTQEDPGVVTALMNKRNEENAMQRKRLREFEEARRRSATQKALELENKRMKTEIFIRKQELKDLTALANVRNSQKTFTLEALGHGATTKSAASRGRANRLALMDRLRTLGSGLSPEQLADFSWFRDKWDKVMEEDHGDLWPEHFMQLVQRIIDEHDNGKRNAFSLFVHSETIRCLSSEKAIKI